MTLADHENIQQPASDPRLSRKLSEHAGRVAMIAFAVGLGGLLVALLVALLSERGIEQFAFSYLTSFAFFLSLSLGCMCFVLLTHLFRAGWCVVVRRPAEVFAANIPILALLSIPILIFVLANNGMLYPWAQNFDDVGGHATASEVEVHLVVDAPAADGGAAHGDDTAHGDADAAHAGDDHARANLAYMVNKKQPWLSGWFFTLRWLVYLGAWSGIGLWYWRTSTQQDSKIDDSLTLKREVRAAPLTLLFAVTITFASFDLLMSLDPAWYSTIFGVYYFAGSFMGAMALLILVLMGLQRRGYLQSVNTEHYHDLGKLLFAFVFFWGYIAFSQYMLLWYASLPETIYWYDIRRVTTVSERMDLFGWTGVALLLLFGHLLIPFMGLLSRHAKRNHKVLAFWAVWLLVMHWIDLYWLVMPVFDNVRVMPGLIELGCLVGIGGIFIGGATRLLSRHSLVPVNDPRLSESLNFQNA